MKQNYTQGSTFSIEQHVHPIHGLYKYRMTQLESKVCFYEGQVEPLRIDNASLKQDLIEALRTISLCGDILRKLIPINDPNKKLQIEMATLEEISRMVCQETDWLLSQISLRDKSINMLKETIEKLQKDWRQQLKQKQDQIQALKMQKQQNQKQLRVQIQRLQQMVLQSERENAAKISQIKSNTDANNQIIQKLTKQLVDLKSESYRMKLQFQRIIKQLNEKIAQNEVACEQAKQLVKQLYQKLMNQKIAETVQLYEYMLKSKEQEKMALALSKDQSEETLRGIIALRDQSVKNLAGTIQKKKLEINELLCRLQFIEQQLCQQKDINGNLQKQLSKSQQDTRQLAMKIKEQQEVQRKELLELSNIIKGYEQQIVKIKQEAILKISQLQKEKHQIIKELQEKNLRISKLEEEAGQVEATFHEKIEKQKAKWQEREKSLNQELIHKNRIIEEEYIRGKEASQKYQQELFTLKTRHLDELHDMETIYHKNKDKLAQEHQQTLRRLREAEEESVVKLRFQYQTSIQELKNSNNKKLQDLNSQFTLLLERQRVKYTQQAQELQNALKMAKLNESEIKFRLQRTEKILMQKQKQMEDTIIEHIKKFKRLEEQSESEKHRLNEALDQQMIDFQKELENQITAMASMQAQMQIEIDHLKDMKGITAVEDKFRKEIEQIRKKYNQQSRKTQEKFRDTIQYLNDAHSKDLNHIRSNHQLQLGQIKQQHYAHVQSIQGEFKKIMLRIAESTEDKVSYINDRLQDGIVEADLQKSPLQKIVEHTFRNIQRKEEIINRLKDAISSLQYKLIIKTGLIEEFENKDELYLQEKVRNRKEEYEIFKKELLAKMEAVTKDCQTQLEAAQREKLQYTTNMFNEFDKLKNDHQKRFNILEKKYIELELLFEQRPSRQEDLAKIKDLINLKAKMDMQMQNYQKKVQTANEIVKYLNLQLENYKQTYDIFGANVSNQPVENNLRNRTTSINFSKEQMSPLNDKKKGNPLQQISRHKEGFKSIAKEATKIHRQSQSPVVKELNVFGDIKHSESSANSEPMDQFQLPEKKYNGSIKKERVRTEKREKEEQMISHASNFIRLIKGCPEEGSNDTGGRQKDLKAKKNSIYRTRRLSKRVTTNPSENY